ncbi:hypothetical protein [Streptomyces sp. SID12501]|uniref:Tat pathway signal sequence domain protein n=1 Tax=Streptomyces sp. SID12501 TaxID=2706042 RepID=A0A6B3BND3_9ACTN|nr:hypothetical protein [Streptomyces sp. SID12501]NEC84623.1 hypothetical protein [Streptomyces sp. SID12501]
MTPWLHTLRTCGTLLALAAPTLAASPHGTTSSYDNISHVARPAPDASRAGSQAGEGRERPGRRESSPPDEAAYEAAVPFPDPTSVPDAPRGADARTGTASGPVLRILPLGSGLVLIGLGLGLALLTLRLRVRRT